MDIQTTLFKYLITFIFSMTPVIELRGSIPYAILQADLSHMEAASISIFGGICTCFILLAILPGMVTFCEKKIPFMHRIMEKVFDKTRSKHSQKMEVVGDIALITIVSVPLPGTGAWTGSMLAYLFGVPYKRGVGLISIGVIISGISVTLLTKFGGSLWTWILTFF